MTYVNHGDYLALWSCSNRVPWFTMTTSQLLVNVTVINPTLSQQKPIPVTNNFLSPSTFLPGRSKVVGDRIYCTNKKETQHHCSKYFICFKKRRYTTHYLVIEEEFLLTWVTHSNAYDPFVHVALPKRVDPCVHPLTVVTHLWPLVPNA